MKTKKWASLMTVLFVFTFLGTTQAAVYNFTPTDPDLGDLVHQNYYRWGINWSIPASESLLSASLFFDNIQNWDASANVLYAHLLLSAPVGLVTFFDNEGGGDNFFGQGILLNQWNNLPTTPQDITYNFDNSELSTLVSYLTDDNFGIGLDPDCHYYNDGIRLTLTTDPVPEPATMLLFGTGLVGLAGLGKKKLLKKGI